MKKILFTDLDGTLLKDDKSISEKNQAAIKKMLDAGHCVVVATGRAVSSGFEVVKKLGLTMPGCYMLAFNGAVVYDCYTQSILGQKTIRREDVEYLFLEAQKQDIHVQTYQGSELLTTARTPELDYYVTTSGTPYRVVEDVMGTLVGEPNKVLLASLTDKGKLEQFQQDHMEWEKGKCSSIFSCDFYLEYCPYQTDKGSGIRFLCDFLKVDLKDTYAVGDERNDISMIKAAGTGIAMKNAKDEVKEAADYITGHDNEHDAIAEIAERFILH